MRLLTRIFMLSICLTSVVQAQLLFKQEKLSFTAKSSDSELTAEFAFINKGDTPVTITEIKSSCGCTAATPDKKVYAPGESGTIAATFTFGERSGLQNKTVHVTTDYLSSNKHKLELEVNILKSITLKPNLLRWKVGGEAKTQRIVVTLLDPENMEFEGPEASPDGFTIKQVDSGTQGEIWLDVTPDSVSEKSMKRSRLFVKSGEKQSESQVAYFMIR